MSFIPCIPMQIKSNKSPLRNWLKVLLLCEIGHLSSPSRLCLSRIILICDRRGGWCTLLDKAPPQSGATESLRRSLRQQKKPPHHVDSHGAPSRMLVFQCVCRPHPFSLSRTAVLTAPPKPSTHVEGGAQGHPEPTHRESKRRGKPDLPLDTMPHTTLRSGKRKHREKQNLVEAGAALQRLQG